MRVFAFDLSKKFAIYLLALAMFRVEAKECIPTEVPTLSASVGDLFSNAKS
jgi:hypothetical protein